MRIGVALAPDRLVAALPGGRLLETTDVADLERTFRELRDAAGAARAAVTVALVPPLVELRRISLPPLSADERRRLLGRDAARYFVGVREAQVVGSTAMDDRGAVLAAAASAALVAALEEAVRNCGWRLEAIVPAHIAWAASCPLDQTSVVVPLPHATEILRVEEGEIRACRRHRPGEFAAAATLSDPVPAAAARAARVRQLELLSDQRTRARTATARRVASRLAAAAGVLLALSAAVDYWGMTRELDAVRERRTALAPRVAAAIGTRDSLAALTTRLTALRDLEATQPRWSGFVADLADELPRDAHLLAFRGAADSVLLDGVARQAAAVFEALQQSPKLDAVRATAPIRQDALPDGTVREEFAFTARVRRGGGP